MSYGSVQYPVVLWRGDKYEVATLRVPSDLTLAEVDVITSILRTVAVDADPARLRGYAQATAGRA